MDFENYKKIGSEGKLQDAKAFVWDTIKIIIISLAIIVPIRYYVVSPFFVRGASMEPTFENKDYIFIDKISYRFQDPKRGEVIVFRFPGNTSQFFIKRIVGLPGETIKIKNNEVFIYNDQNPEGFVFDESNYLGKNQKTLGDILMKLDDNDYFLLGDNRLQSSDSRQWGATNKTLIIGRVLMRIWPFDKIKKFSYNNY